MPLQMGGDSGWVVLDQCSKECLNLVADTAMPGSVGTGSACTRTWQTQSNYLRQRARTDQYVCAYLTPTMDKRLGLGREMGGLSGRKAHAVRHERI